MKFVPAVITTNQGRSILECDSFKTLTNILGIHTTSILHVTTPSQMARWRGEKAAIMPGVKKPLLWLTGPRSGSMCCPLCFGSESAIGSDGTSEALRAVETELYLPGDFYAPAFVRQLKSATRVFANLGMRWHGRAPVFGPHDLETATYVFVLQEPYRKSLQFFY